MLEQSHDEHCPSPILGCDILAPWPCWIQGREQRNKSQVVFVSCAPVLRGRGGGGTTGK